MVDNDSIGPASEGSWLEPTQALAFCDPSEASVRKPGKADENPVRYGFRIGTLGLMVARQTPSEVIGQLPVFPVPNTPRWFPGLINLRGNLIPTFDLKHLLEIPEDPKHDQRLLVLDKGDAAAGVIIDGFPQPLRPTEALARLPRLSPLLEEHVQEAFVLEDFVWLELDHCSFFHALGRLMQTAGGMD